MTNQNEARFDLAGVRLNNLIQKTLIGTDQGRTGLTTAVSVTAFSASEIRTLTRGKEETGPPNKHHQDIGQARGGRRPLVSALTPCLLFCVLWSAERKCDRTTRGTKVVTGLEN